MKVLNKFIIYYLPVIIWALIIFSFSSRSAIPTSQIHWQDFIVKKTAHIIEYAIFSILLYRLLKNNGVSKTRSVWLAILIACIYGATDEFHQSFTPGREPTLRDIGFDTIGATLGGYFVWKLLPKMPHQLRDWGKKLELI